jgi:diguanylate cyclase (GGDEF)-like protein
MNILAIAVADYIGLILLIAMLYSSRIRRKEPRFEFKLFSIITIMSAVACVVDFLVFFSDGRTQFIFRAINVLGNAYCFITNPLFVLAWCMYTDLRLYDSIGRIKRIYKYAVIPGMVLVLSVFVNFFVPIIYYFDENNYYHRLPFSYIFYVVEAGYMIFSLYTLKQYEKRYDKVRFFPMFLMIGPIFAGCALQLIFYGISLIWVSLAVGLTSIYMSLQNEFSYVDTLTGLYNRAYLDYILEIRARERNSQLGGIMIDVDYFKAINDNFGHSVGDEALIDVARVIRLGMSDGAIAIRFAGDEFIVLSRRSTKESLQKMIRNIRDEVDLFNENEDRQYKLSLSIGYTMFDYDKDNIDSFFRHMDDNMYEEKARKHAAR